MPFKLTRTMNGLLLAGLIGLGATTAFSTLPTMAVPAGTPLGGEANADSAVAHGGDPVRGKVVYQTVGRCTECHGWGGDGTGSNPRSPGSAANLRETQLDTETLVEIISCGVPGTPMPYHLSAAYKSHECYGGVTLDSFEQGQAPVKGKTFREKDVMNVVAFIQEYFASLAGTKPDLAECEAFFKPGARNCAGLK